MVKLLARAHLILLLLPPFTLATVVERDDQLDQVISILKGLPIASKFCSSLIYPNGPTTKTSTITVKETETACSTKTETTVEKDTSTLEISTTLPMKTRYIYSTTKFVPSPPGRKRDALPTGAERSANPTPAAVAGILPSILSKVCSSIFPAPTTTATTTATTTRTRCTSTVTSRRTRLFSTTTTTFTIFPPPASVTKTGTLTTTVPAACLKTPYAPTQAVPPSLSVTALSYPYFPDGVISCCALCYEQLGENCVGSAYFAGSDSCELLINIEDQGPAGKSKLCPLGLATYDFGPQDPQAGVLIGPCEKR